jgi:F-type H+-transporting ATPase subunit b
MFSDPTFIAQVALALFIGLLIYLKVPGMIAKALDEQSLKIARELDDAQRLRSEAETLLSSFAAKRAQAEAEAKEIVERAKTEADRIAAEARQTLAEQVARRVNAAEDRIARAEAQAVNDIRAAAAEASTEAARLLLAEKLDASGRSQLFKDGLVELQGTFR